MIFVSVGTESHPFPRLISALHSCQNKGIIDEQMIVQGYVNCSNLEAEHHEMLPFEEWNRLLQQARIVISHGGPGVIMSVLRHNKVPIVVPRQHTFGEHVDDHQVKFTQFLESKGVVIAVYDIKNLEHVLQNYEQLLSEHHAALAPTLNGFELAERMDKIVHRLTEKE